jgi:hypothetical protein
MKEELRSAGCKDALWAMWTWDLIDYGDDGVRRAWFESVAPHMHVVFLNEVGRQGMWRRGLGVQMQHVVDGTVSIALDSDGGGIGDGIGLRPLWRLKSSGRGVVFVGSPGSADTRLQSNGRLDLLRQFSHAGVSVDVFGPEDEWDAHGIESMGVIGGVELCEVYRSAAAVIAMSRDIRTSSSASAAAVGLYRSDRTLCITGCGGTIVSECFHGYREFFGDDVGRCASSVQDFVDIVSEMQSSSSSSSSSSSLSSSLLLESVTWAYFSWEDSIDVVFTTLDNKDRLVFPVAESSSSSNISSIGNFASETPSSLSLLPGSSCGDDRWLSYGTYFAVVILV